MTNAQILERVTRPALPGELVNARGEPIHPESDPAGVVRAVPPVGRLVVAPGQAIASAWGNTTFDQTMQTFASAADRANQWPAPGDGAQSWLMDSRTPWVFRSGVWKGLPLGFLAYVNGPAATMNAASNTTVSVAVNVIAGRRYRISCFGNGTQQGVVGQVRMTIGGPIDSIQTRFSQIENEPVSGNAYAHAVYLYSAATSAAQTWSVIVSTTAGTINCAVNSNHVLVEDIGS